MEATLLPAKVIQEQSEKIRALDKTIEKLVGENTELRQTGAKLVYNLRQQIEAKENLLATNKSNQQQIESLQAQIARQKDLIQQAQTMNDIHLKHIGELEKIITKKGNTGGEQKEVKSTNRLLKRHKHLTQKHNELRQELSDKEKAIKLLQNNLKNITDQVKKQREEIKTLKQANTAPTTSLDEQIQRLRKQIAKLKAKVQAKHDETEELRHTIGQQNSNYEDAKKQIETLQASLLRQRLVHNARLAQIDNTLDQSTRNSYIEEYIRGVLFPEHLQPLMTIITNSVTTTDTDLQLIVTWTNHPNDLDFFITGVTNINAALQEKLLVELAKHKEQIHLQGEASLRNAAYLSLPLYDVNTGCHIDLNFTNKRSIAPIKKGWELVINLENGTSLSAESNLNNLDFLKDSDITFQREKLLPKDIRAILKALLYYAADRPRAFGYTISHDANTVLRQALNILHQSLLLQSQVDINKSDILEVQQLPAGAKDERKFHAALGGLTRIIQQELGAIIGNRATQGHPHERVFYKNMQATLFASNNYHAVEHNSLIYCCSHLIATYLLRSSSLIEAAWHKLNQYFPTKDMQIANLKGQTQQLNNLAAKLQANISKLQSDIDRANDFANQQEKELNYANRINADLQWKIQNLQINIYDLRKAKNLANHFQRLLHNQLITAGEKPCVTPHSELESSKGPQTNRHTNGLFPPQGTKPIPGVTALVMPPFAAKN